MIKENKSAGFRSIIHFFSCWGFGDSVVALLGTVSAFFWPRDGKSGDWLGVLIGVCAIIVYYGIGSLSRPLESDEEKGESQD